MKGTAGKKKQVFLSVIVLVFLITLLSAALKARPGLQLLAVSCEFQHHGVTLRSICN